MANNIQIILSVTKTCIIIFSAIVMVVGCIRIKNIVPIYRKLKAADGIIDYKIAFAFARCKEDLMKHCGGVACCGIIMLCEIFFNLL